ncbi:nitrate- and nitrite sensing domain-containing protein [Streptomyces sp. 35G-GA-8]|uniref:nitrate- and nitrite sensing domain-containing protein n=1 Tax=Streptomyces sp. 35G-GA-8 TaxID=2939434 RepID=UPI00201ECDB1|nr:nitrate- and nitrite sensing domain-containing protein [Streptomyces sp. 35G-GA-8]MCL7382637.1 nitrate- and nitrite sensing domain-containing protein [Streptomyces sp. 35G-GA-8]
MRRSKTSSAEQQARGNFTPPPRAAVPPAVATGSPPVAGSSSRFSPRNWRVPTRLNAILLVPVLVGLVMGGFQVKGSIDTWQEAQDAEKTALVVRAASEYGRALLNERDLTAQPLLTNKRDAQSVVQARAATDAAKRKFDVAVRDMPAKQGLERRLGLFRGEEPKLENIRKTAYTAGVETPDKNGGNGGPVATEEGYVLVQHSLMEFANELGLGTGNITSYGRTVYAIQLARAAGSLQRSIGMHLLVRPSQKDDVRDGQSIAFSSYAYLEDIAVAEYVSGGTAEDTVRLQDVMREQAAAGARKLATAQQQAMAAGQDFKAPPSKDGSVLDGMVAAIATGDSPEQLAARGVTPETWMAASTATFDGYTEIEKDLVDRAVTEAAQISDNARNDAIINGAVVVLALLAAFILAGMMARQMSRSMRSLRTAAFGIAEQRLPMLVDQLSRAEPGRVDTRVQPIPIDSRDEIGEVARAFDQVHREAVRLAAEQAMLRGNVNAIFTNLSRRNQSLIEGQLSLISDLENNEGDPDQLENLFKLDHLATRMRRNGENLLVLAGEEPGRRWNQPVPLVDVLRAASSEVESYERIELSGVPETEIHGQSVTDLVHLLAELLENATTFSSPQTKVRVTATRLPDGRVMIEIHDKGIGLTAEDFADINHKLANPPIVDAAVSQRMGLFVVGRLSDRHGIRVQLRPSGEQAGTTSLVMLPDAITHGGGGEPAAPDDFTVSGIIPDQPAAPAEEQVFPTAPMLTAAELGFDDSRYDEQQPAAGDSRALDPVNRTLRRDERRAALGGAQNAPQPLYTDQADGQYREEVDGRYAPQQASYDAGFAARPEENGTAYQGGGYEEYRAPDAYQGQQAYTEASYQPQGSPEGTYDNAFGAQPHQEEWPAQSGYQDAYQAESRTEAESAGGAPEKARERVGFDRPGPSPSASHALTDAGLPRRGSSQQPQEWGPSGQHEGPTGQAGQAGQTSQAGQTGRPVGTPPLGGGGGQGNARSNGHGEGDSAVSDGGSGDGGSGGRSEATGAEDWRSANDDRWQRAEKLREPKAGGVTSSGLPRRVPKANLVEGAAEQTPQSGTQVSRAPEDIRGRLSNLRRGVQRGRNAGADTNGPGYGSGSTYNQER